jgi:quaternary ammonium compound-resistance protein SugE
MNWLVLILAGLLEIGWVLGLKESAGFTRLVPSVLTVVALIASLALLGLALKSLPVGTAYAVWTGIGAVGAAFAGIWLYGDDASPIRLGSLALVVAGIAGLKFTGEGERRQVARTYPPRARPFNLPLAGRSKSRSAISGRGRGVRGGR